MSVQLAQANSISLPLADESVHCCITSPPYFGLRSYDLPPTVWSGDPDCEHEWNETTIPPRHSDDGITGSTLGGGKTTQTQSQRQTTTSAFCQRCSAWRGSLGLEPDVSMYVAHLVEVFREVRRVLRSDGVVWLNLGMSYASGMGNTKSGLAAAANRIDGGNRRADAPSKTETVIKRGQKYLGYKPKDLIPIPWLVALALQADGWWLRSAPVWLKKNALPESVKDRPTTSHEYWLLLSKKKRYFYDTEAVRVSSSIQGVWNIRSIQRTNFINESAIAGDNARFQEPAVISIDVSISAFAKALGFLSDCIRHTSALLDTPELQDNLSLSLFDSQIGQKSSRNVSSQLVSYGPVIRRCGALAGRLPSTNFSIKEFLEELYSLWMILPEGDECKEDWRAVFFDWSHINANSDGTIRVHNASQVSQFDLVHNDIPPDEQYTTQGTSLSNGRNRRTTDFFFESLDALIADQHRYLRHLERVREDGGMLLDEDGDPLALVFNTKGYAGAHYATFPPAMIEPLVKCSTSERGVCPRCGAGWERVVKRTSHQNKREQAHCPNNYPTKTDSTGWAPVAMATEQWRPTCDCDAGEPVPAVVLDPFVGSGTVPLVARKLGRHGVGFDLSFDYLRDQARARLELDAWDDWHNGGRQAQAAWDELPLFALSLAGQD